MAPKKREQPLVKHYVLDTNVLLHDPQAMFRFEENWVWIPIEVLEEMDRFKAESTTRGANAREVHRRLNERFPSSEQMRKGVELENGGRLQVCVNPTLTWNAHGGWTAVEESQRYQAARALFPDFSINDNRILAVAAYLADTRKEPTILVTKDLNLQLKARALGLEAEDYRTDRIDSDSDIQRIQKGGGPEDYETIEIPAQRLQAFASEGHLELPGPRPFFPNQYVLLRNADQPAHGVPARYMRDGVFRTLRRDHIVIRGGRTLQALNLGQRFLLDALYDPDITLVTVYGKAGTGKTLLSVGAALEQVQIGEYEKMLITRVIMPTGRDIGFLPGRMEEKMEPWVQPAYDALEQLLARPRKPEQFEKKRQSSRKAHPFPTPPLGGVPNGKPHRPYDTLIQAGLLEIEAITHIRGRSIPRAIFIVDESQQLTPHEAKTLVTRMGKGSKMLLIGDLGQIDNPYVDAHTNGLVYTRNRLQGQPFLAHVNLFKGERSEMAEVAANLM
ncbi:MAG TPA: PhoH family protein [Chthoniobacteraceae bacterium]